MSLQAIKYEWKNGRELLRISYYSRLLSTRVLFSCRTDYRYFPCRAT